MLLSGLLSAQNQEPLVMISTEYGDIIVKLYNDTPHHRDNFLQRVKQGAYDGTTFHRVIKDFMIQGGGSTAYTLPAEIRPKHFHKKGTLAAARRPDQVNPEKRSSGSQFYLVEGRIYSPKELQKIAQHSGRAFSKEQFEAYSSLGGSPHLDGDYTVFGEVVMGLGVVEKISKVKTGENDKPVKSIVMTAKLLE
jgi:peptidyl-prolyl cis-trans isomerase B (cyclophilin B)